MFRFVHAGCLVRWNVVGTLFRFLFFLFYFLLFGGFVIRSRLGIFGIFGIFSFFFFYFISFHFRIFFGIGPFFNFVFRLSFFFDRCSSGGLFRNRRFFNNGDFFSFRLLFRFGAFWRLFVNQSSCFGAVILDNGQRLLGVRLRNLRPQSLFVLGTGLDEPIANGLQFRIEGRCRNNHLRRLMALHADLIDVNLSWTGSRGKSDQEDGRDNGELHF